MSSATFLLHSIDPNETVVTNISLAGHDENDDETLAVAKIDSITFSNGQQQTLNVPSFMGTSASSNIVNILYSIHVVSCNAIATLFFLGLT